MMILKHNRNKLNNILSLIQKIYLLLSKKMDKKEKDNKVNKKNDNYNDNEKWDDFYNLNYE